MLISIRDVNLINEMLFIKYYYILISYRGSDKFRVDPVKMEGGGGVVGVTGGRRWNSTEREFQFP